MNVSIKKSTLAGLLAISFIASSAMAANLTFAGYGGWRSASSGNHGVYKTYNKTWSQCRNKCLSQNSCTGVEFSMRASGKTLCEVHTDKFKETATGTGYATVWTK